MNRRRERLRQLAGSAQPGVNWLAGRLIEGGVADKRRLAAGIVRRLEAAFSGTLAEAERAGVVQVSLSPKLSVALADLATALEHSPGGVAGLVLKVVLADQHWSSAVYAAASNDKARQG